MARPLYRLLWWMALLVAAAPAYAKEAVVVLDRGEASAEGADARAETALRLIEALRTRGTNVRFIVYGTKPSGRVLGAELRGDPREAVARVSERTGWLFEGPTDPRIALELAIRRVGEVASLDVYLIGAFGGDGVSESRTRAAVAKWAAFAPTVTRILPVGLAPEGRALVEAMRGRVVDGTLVLGVSDIQVEPQPWSPFAGAPEEEPVLEARFHVGVETLSIGAGTTQAILEATSDEADDEVRPTADGGFLLRRRGTSKRVATIRVTRAETPDVDWFVDEPPPRTFQWTELRPAARLTSATGGAPLPFKVTDAEAGTPLTIGYRLVRTRTGPSPVFTFRAQRGDLPLGLDVAFGREAAVDDVLASRDVRVSFEAYPGRPLQARGHIVIESTASPEMSFAVAYDIHVPPGIAVARLEAPGDPVPLPASETTPWTLVVEPKNANVPARARVGFRTDPPAAAEALEVRLQSDTETLTRPLADSIEVRTGVPYAVVPDLRPGARIGTATVVLAHVEAEGMRAVAQGEGLVRARRPALVVTGDAWHYRLEDGGVVADPAIRLTLDPDGGSGDWLLALQEIAPRVSVPPEAPVGWEIHAAGPGAWTLNARGAWRGDRAGIFAAREDRVVLRVDWPGGAAPGTLEVDIEIPARWGAAGWILVGLAVLALALGFWGILQLRPVPIGGTLLYTVADRAGAVGRLDLSAVGRRPAVVRADAMGRLHLGGKGTSVLLLRPTRVGGLAVVADEDGRTEHLLVDGLTLALGRHRVRYVSGVGADGAVPAAQAEGEDLLGPDFDLPTGRINALEDPPEASAPDAR